MPYSSGHDIALEPFGCQFEPCRAAPSRCGLRRCLDSRTPWLINKSAGGPPLSRPQFSLSVIAFDGRQHALFRIFYFGRKVKKNLKFIENRKMKGTPSGNKGD